MQPALPKRLVLFGDGRNDVGDYRRHAIPCTPEVTPERQGALHVLLLRALCVVAPGRSFTWVEPMPRRGFRNGVGGLCADLRGKGFGKLQGEGLLGPYWANHAVDVAVVVCDAETSDPVEVARAAADLHNAGAVPKGVRAFVAGVAAPCLEAWLLGRRATDASPADALKQELRDRHHVTDTAGRRRFARERTDVRALYCEVEEFRRIVDDLSATLGP